MRLQGQGYVIGTELPGSVAQRICMDTDIDSSRRPDQKMIQNLNTIKELLLKESGGRVEETGKGLRDSSCVLMMLRALGVTGNTSTSPCAQRDDGGVSASPELSQQETLD